MVISPDAGARVRRAPRLRRRSRRRGDGVERRRSRFRPRKLAGRRTTTAGHGLSHGFGAHALEARRAGQPAADVDRAGDQRRDARGRGGRRRPHRLAGGPRRRRPPALRRRLDRPGADRGAPRLAAGGRAAHLRLPALRGAGGARQRAAPGRGQRRRSRSPAIGRFSDPPAIDGAGVLALGVLGLAGNVAATLVLARGEREDINLEGVLRHSAADALGSLGVIVAGAFVLAGGSDVVDPIVGLLISVLVLASSWRLIKEPFDVLMEAAPGRPRRRRDRARRSAGRRRCAPSTTSTSGPSPPASAPSPPTSSSPGAADRDLIRRRLELTLRERFGIEHTTLQMEEEAEGGCCGSRTPRSAERRSRKPGCRDLCARARPRFRRSV